MSWNDQHLKNEIKHLKKVLRDINGYPNWVIQQAIEKVKNQKKMARSVQVTSNNEENEHLLMLFYKKNWRNKTKIFTEICHTSKYHVQNYLYSIEVSFKI